MTVFVLFTSWVHGQETSPASAQRPIAESAERIAREIWSVDPPPFYIDEEGRPRFRSGVTEMVPPPLWRLAPDMSLTPARGAISHKEMLRVMTPKEFSPPLISASVDPGSVYNSFKQGWRDWQARRIHERIEREREELERLRADGEASK